MYYLPFGDPLIMDNFVADYELIRTRFDPFFPWTDAFLDVYFTYSFLLRACYDQNMLDFLQRDTMDSAPTPTFFFLFFLFVLTLPWPGSSLLTYLFSIPRLCTDTRTILDTGSLLPVAYLCAMITDVRTLSASRIAAYWHTYCSGTLFPQGLTPPKNLNTLYL